MLNLLSRLEVNVGLGSDVSRLSSFAIKNRIPAIVVPPELVTSAIMLRQGYLNKFRVICTVDFPEGRCFAGEKVGVLPSGALNADGFEILLSSGRTDKECENELSELYRFFRKDLAGKELRYCLNLHGRKFEDIIKFFKHFKKFPPDFLRTNVDLRLQRFKDKDHADAIRMIRERSGVPIKLCGNVSPDTVINFQGKVARYDVGFDAAQRVVSVLGKRSREIRENASSGAVDSKARS